MPSSAGAGTAAWAGSRAIRSAGSRRTGLWPEAQERHRLRPELRAGRGPAARVGAAGSRLHLGLCPQPGLPRRAEGPAEAARRLAARADRGGGEGLRRHRTAAGEAPGAAGGARLAGQAHQPRLPRARLLAVPGHHPDRAGAAGGPAGRGPLRLLPPLPRRLPDRRLPGPLPARCAALHQLPDHRAPGPDPARAAPAHGQPDLWLRRLPRGLPLEQVRGGRARGQAAGARGSRRTSRWPSLPALDDAGFRRRFSGSPVKRIGRDRFVRNVLVAIGNSGDGTLVPAATGLLGDPAPSSAAWRSGRWASCCRHPG